MSQVAQLRAPRGTPFAYVGHPASIDRITTRSGVMLGSMITRSLAVLALIAASAIAEPAKPPRLQESFAFDVMKLRTKCARVTGALLTRLSKSYRCGPADTDTASGVKTVAVCKAKTGDSQFLLFATNADCENERQTQLANGA